MLSLIISWIGNTYVRIKIPYDTSNICILRTEIVMLIMFDFLNLSKLTQLKTISFRFRCVWSRKEFPVVSDCVVSDRSLPDK